MDRGEAHRSPWPSIGFEEIPWEPREVGPTSRSASRRHRGPYRAAITPEIASRPVPLSGVQAAELDDATNEMARFDAEFGQELAPFGPVLLRSESAASSQIENLTASARAIAEAELRPASSDNASLVVANTRAMRTAVALAGRIDEEGILAMHDALLGPSRPEIVGRWRTEAVWIGGSTLGPHLADFVPPHHDRVVPAIADLVAFIERDDVPVLAQAAIAHAQFETIHPFPDGNGRTGRALLQAHLRLKGLTRNVTVPVSAGLLADTGAYFTALDDYRAGDPSVIIEQLVSASFAAIGNGRTLVEDLRDIRAKWTEQITVRRGALAWDIADLLLRRPAVSATVAATELDARLSNVYPAIEALVHAEVAVESTDRKRNRIWRAPEVLEALDRFAARAGRRRRPA